MDNQGIFDRNITPELPQDFLTKDSLTLSIHGIDFNILVWTGLKCILVRLAKSILRFTLAMVLQSIKELRLPYYY